MQTLGANNIYGVTGNPLGIQNTRPTRSSQISVKDVFSAENLGGHLNPAYESDNSPRNSLKLQQLSGQAKWQGDNRN